MAHVFLHWAFSMIDEKTQKESAVLWKTSQLFWTRSDLIDIKPYTERDIILSPRTPAFKKIDPNK